MLLLYPKIQYSKLSTIQELKKPRDLNFLSDCKLNNKIFTSRNVFTFVFRDLSLNYYSKRSIPIISMVREKSLIPLCSWDNCFSLRFNSERVWRVKTWLVLWLNCWCDKPIISLCYKNIIEVFFCILNRKFKNPFFTEVDFRSFNSRPPTISQLKTSRSQFY